LKKYDILKNMFHELTERKIRKEQEKNRKLEIWEKEKK
jgi:hypothetical protein